MLKGKIYLDNCDYSEILQLAIERNEADYPIKCIEEAITVNLKAKLNYNTKTGKTCYGSEVRAEYTKKEDIQEYMEVLDLVRWELLGWVMNSASRLSRGLKAI